MPWRFSGCSGDGPFVLPLCPCVSAGKWEGRSRGTCSAPAGISVTGRSGEEFRHRCLISRHESAGTFSTSSRSARSSASMLKPGWKPAVCRSVALGCCGSSAIGDSVC